MSTPSHIAWVDLETTDSDPYSDRAAILEVGAVITRHDPQLTEVSRASLLIRPPGAQTDHDLLWSRMIPVVQTMHRENGLWEEATTSDQAWDLVQADPALARFIADSVESDGGQLPTPMAGSGVAQLDLPFAKVHLPATAARLTYWMLDIGMIRRMLQLAGRDDLVDLDRDVTAKGHRGLADVLLHVEEARGYLELLASIPRREQAV